MVLIRFNREEFRQGVLWVVAVAPDNRERSYDEICEFESTIECNGFEVMVTMGVKNSDS